MLSGMCIVLTSDCCHATLFHPARTFTTVCYFNPVKNPIKSHKTRTATNRIMLAQCLTIRIKIQICNLRNGVFLTSWLTAFCSEFIIATRNVYGGGHWGVLNTAKPQKKLTNTALSHINSPNTAIPQDVQNLVKNQ